MQPPLSVPTVLHHYSDVVMRAMASLITGASIVYSGCSSTDQSKHQGSASLAFVRGIHQWPVNSPHKGPVTRKMFSFDDVMLRTGDFQVSHSDIYRYPICREHYNQFWSWRFNYDKIHITWYEVMLEISTLYVLFCSKKLQPFSPKIVIVRSR